MDIQDRASHSRQFLHNYELFTLNIILRSNNNKKKKVKKILVNNLGKTIILLRLFTESCMQNTEDFHNRCI